VRVLRSAPMSPCGLGQIHDTHGAQHWPNFRQISMLAQNFLTRFAGKISATFGFARNES
jgi:hypothetical protein